MLELKPHVGRNRTGELVEHDQYLVYWNGRHVGYIGKLPGAPLNLIERVAESVRVQILAAVNERLGSGDQAARLVTEPRKVSQPPILVNDDQA